MLDFNKPIVIFGAGSIGERHIRNLWQLGFHNLYVYRQRQLPFRDIGSAKVKVVYTIKDVVSIKPYACFITSPTSFHIEQTIISLQIGAHVFIEKPLSSSVKDTSLLLDTIRSKNCFVYVGYMMRFHPHLLQIQDWITSGYYGKLISIQSKWGEYLPDWHPWEDYRISYAAKKDLGGGVALTLSHDIDIANWLAGSPISNSYIQKNTISDLDVDVESGADILLKYENGITANIHLNFYEKSKERFLKLIFDQLSINVDYNKSIMTITGPNYSETFQLDKFDRNDLFLNQTRYFFSKTKNFSIEDSVQQIQNAINIINICNANL